MAPHGLCCVFFVLIVQTCAVYGQGEILKGSLTFVIDDTASMSEEIRQVKEEVNIIFEKVLSSNASQIENFVLVTFNDPDALVRTITKDRTEFKTALAAINVHGGGLCPEYAMTGIELALTASLPLSFLYVFTDASAEDYTRFEEIKSLAQKKQSQVVFLLTGECDYTRSREDYLVYHKVAEATGGQVFHMMRDDVKDILKYIEESITGRGATLVNTKLPPGYRKKIKYLVDSHTGEVLISVTGTKPKIGEVTGPDGCKPIMEPLFSGKAEMAIVKVKNTKPGIYVVEVGSISDTHVVITAKSDLNFQLGFSIDRPNSMKDTVTRPVPEGISFLGIRLLGSGVKLTTAKILDLSGSVITELPLELVDGKSQFYVSPSFNPPFTIFQVAIIGRDLKTNTIIERKGPAPISRQDVSGKKVNTAPVIAIDGEPKIITEYGAPLRLKCNVHGYPAPDIIWEDDDTGVRMTAKVQLVEVPYDYASILEIDKAIKNVTYQCEASNAIGTAIKFVQVETERKNYFDVIEAPTDIRVAYNKEGRLVCKVDAYPPATITWYKDGTVISRNTNVDISNDKSILTIKHMQPKSQGKYTCEARNDFNRKVWIAKVLIFGVEAPVIDKSHEEIFVTEKTNAALSCRILKGIPKPIVSWSFRPEGGDTFRVMKETREIVHLNNVRKYQTGSYKCKARNILGSDTFTMDLVVEYPPTVKEDVAVMQIKDDDEVRISCDVTGEPAPAVRWFFNGTRIDSRTKTRMFSENGLRFKARLADTGSYRCEAANKLGSAKKTAFVHVFVPVTIETPEKSTIEIMVGKSTILYCRADGHPKPNIKWTFQSSDPRIPVKDITPTGGVASVVLKNMQLDRQGLYTCEAENGIGESAHITYDVKVYAPPVIHNVYSTKTFETLEGDVAVRIECKATGRPKPTITWMKNGLNIAIGSEWYEVEDDGTLVIKNIDRHSRGTYVCRAENILGNDTEVYEVIVRVNLLPEIPTNTVFVEEGKTIDIKCDTAHTSTDQVRWYKGRISIASEEILTLYSVTRSDDGLYTCRVSNPTKTRSVTTKVVIGFKPIFTTTEEETVEFVHGADSEILSCEAYGEPRPMSAIWKHNGKVLSTTAMSHPLGMVYGATGIYECEVSNEFGSIHRTFKVTSRDCILNIQKDFPEKQPIMYSPSLGWPVFPVSKGYMIIPHEDYFFFNCPSKFANPGLPLTPNLMAFCERDNKIKINGKIYNFADIKCNDEVKPQVSETGRPCHPGNTEYVEVGYRVYNQFLGVYDVCLDKKNNVPLFAQHRLSPDHTGRSTEAEWSKNLLPQNFDALYNCGRQIYDVSRALGRGLRTRDSCCFDKRQLVNSRNLLPGVPTSAAYNYLNVIPQWSTCNSKNWEDVEQSVRNLAKSAGRDLNVITGIHHGGLSTDITLNDGSGGKQAVPQYLWKVIQDPAQAASLAIIHVNIPELSREEASKYVLCPDICANGISWIEPSNWHNVNDGFTYCCAITEFEIAFGYNGRFSPEMHYVLFDGSLMPEYYLMKK